LSLNSWGFPGSCYTSLYPNGLANTLECERHFPIKLMTREPQLRLGSWLIFFMVAPILWASIFGSYSHSWIVHLWQLRLN